MPRADLPGAAHITNSVELHAWIDEDAYAHLREMMHAWYPGMQRIQGAILTRAIHLLYRQYRRELKRAARAAEDASPASGEASRSS